MVQLSEHGAGCCGIKHIFSFDHSTVADFDAHFSQVCTAGNNNRLTEVVLSQRQVDASFARAAPCVREAGGWPAVLRERGFRLVSRFLNSNSSNNCYVFHHTNTFLSLAPGDLPFAWPDCDMTDDGTLVRNRTNPPAPAPVRVLLSTYHNVFRTSGRSASGWDTRTLAEAANPRASRVDRRDVMSNGTIMWNEDV